MLTTEEAQRISEMREMFDEIEERIGRLAVDETVNPTGDVKLYNLGQFRESINAAEKALFRALNVGSSYMHCEACDAALDKKVAA